MTIQESNVQKNAELTRALVQAGYDDVLVLNHDTARSVLTDKRRELLHRVAEGDVRSIRGLATELGRDKGQVSRNLDRLYQYDIVEYEHEGTRKVPTLKHETVVVEPIL